MSRKRMLIAATVCVAFLVAASVAWAHYTVVYFPGDAYRSSGAVLDNHQTIRVCDGQVDGHRVRMRMSINSQIYFSGWAPSQNCNTEGHPTISGYRVCVENEGCEPPFSQPGRQP